jgi:glycosyltransferase involved in cell wall biosynthesis
MKLLLVGNYAHDGSISMSIWANILYRELSMRGVEVRLLAPAPVFGNVIKSFHGVGKWLGYIDRYVIFPLKLRRASDWADIVHICDHGSALYALVLKNKRTIITCHDMLAIRGALGEVPDCAASLFGRILQSMIRNGMLCADQVACVSQYTFNDARRVLNKTNNLCVVINGLNHHFGQLNNDVIDNALANIPKITTPYVLHIGSNLTRKNRAGVIRIFAIAAKKIKLQLVFAGEPLDKELLLLAQQLRVRDQIIAVKRPNVETIESLYNRALALIFPSRSEGFGWPPIEAQACGCPVVGSDIPPLVEVLGDSAILLPVDDEAGMADAICRLLKDAAWREQMRQRGLENVHTRFQTSRMIDDYLSLYRKLTCQKL